MTSEIEASIRRLEYGHQFRRRVLRDAAERVAAMEQDMQLKPKTARFGGPPGLSGKGVELTITVTGCQVTSGGITFYGGLPGYTVKITSGTTVVATGTQAVYSNLPDGVLGIEVSHSRYSGTYSASLTAAANTAYTLAVPMNTVAVGNGFVCSGVCGSPLSKSLSVSLPASALYPATTITCVYGYNPTLYIPTNTWMGTFVNSYGQPTRVDIIRSASYGDGLHLVMTRDFGSGWGSPDNNLAMNTTCSPYPISGVHNADPRFNFVEVL